MKIAVDRIKVDETERIRTDVGNLKSLEESIGKVGLINPLIIDEKENLVAGYRRLQACKNLGFQEVKVVVVDFDGDALKKFDVEVAENFFRKDFTPEEILSTEVKRREILESRRKKGIFERLWLWLKSLFSSSPQEDRVGEKKKTDDERAAKVAPAAEMPEKDEDQSTERNHEQSSAGVPEKDEDESMEPDQNKMAAEKGKTESGKERSEESAASVSKQYRRADRDRSIKWRTS